MCTANGMEHPLWFTQVLIYDEKDKEHEAHMHSPAPVLVYFTSKVQEV
jgi:hypothetical protein